MMTMMMMMMMMMMMDPMTVLSVSLVVMLLHLSQVVRDVLLLPVIMVMAVTMPACGRVMKRA
jgi:hypothetical protein